MSINFSSQEFPSIARLSHTTLRWPTKIKKRSFMLRTRKILPTIIDEKPRRWWWTTGSGGERSEWIHTFSFVSPPSRRDGGHDDVSPIFSRQVLRQIKIKKVGTQKRRKPAIYYGKVCKRPPKVGWRWPDGLDNEDDYKRSNMRVCSLLVSAVTMVCLMLL